MRLTRASLRGRVNGALRVRSSSRKITSYAGLELVREYLVQSGFRDHMSRLLKGALPSSDYGARRLILLILGLLIAGGRRLWHLRYVDEDPILQRLAGLNRLPSPMTVGRWLRRFTLEHVALLLALNAEITTAAVRALGLRRMTVDVDGSVLSTGATVQGARRGFNPHHRKVPSYYPITAYEAQSGQILRVHNRSGNVHDGKASPPFLDELLAQLEPLTAENRLLEFRMDGAFFRSDVIKLLDAHGAEWAIKVPFYPWLNLKSYVAQAPEWKRVEDGVSYCESRVAIKTWGRVLRIVLYRKRVFHQTKKNFQLDLFDPDDGYFEYSAITTNKRLGGRALWRFLNGRGAHEKVLGELKNGFAFDAVPTLRYAANSAWQVLSVIAFNLSRGFQVACRVTRRGRSMKRRCLFPFETIHTLRFRLIGCAAALVAPAGRLTLDLGQHKAAATEFNNAIEALQDA